MKGQSHVEIKYVQKLFVEKCTFLSKSSPVDRLMKEEQSYSLAIFTSSSFMFKNDC